jgi:hypothetical protein
MTLFPVEKHLQYKDWLIFEIQKLCPPLIMVLIFFLIKKNFFKHQDEFSNSISSTNLDHETNPFKRIKNFHTGETSHCTNESITPPILDKRYQIFAVSFFLH